MLVDARDPAAIATGIDDAIGRRAKLRERGIERARAFSWDDTASRTQSVYEEALAL